MKRFMIKRVDKRLQAVQCLTGNKIKIIACITMLIDHFSKIFLESIMNDKLFPLYLAGGMSTEQFYGIDAFQKNILNGIGTIAFPLFCLLLSEGFFYTKNRKRYIGGMLAFALISEVPFDIGFFSRYSIAEGTFPFYLQYQNVFFTLFLGLLTLVIIEKVALKISGDGRKSKVTKILCQLGVVIIMAIIAELVKCDYGSQGIVYVSMLYFLRKSRLLQSAGFLIMYMVTTGNQPTIFIVVAALIILLYNGKRGNLSIKYLQELADMQEKKTELKGEIKSLSGTVAALKAAERVRVDFDTIQPEKTLTGAVKGVTVEQIQQLKKVAMTGAAAKQAVVELKKKNAALEKENAEMQKKIPSTMDRLLEKKNLELLETRNFNLRQENKELKEALEEERSFSDRLLEGIDRVLDMLERHLPKQLLHLVDKARDLLPEHQTYRQENSTREVIPGAI